MQTSPGARRTAALLGTVATAALLAGCSTSSPGTPSTGTTSTATARTATTRTATTSTATAGTGAPSTSASGHESGTAPDKAALAALLLVTSDLPAGWSASAPDSTSQADDSAGQARFAKCVGIRNTHADKVAEADSQDFSKQDASISSSASSYSSAADVTADSAAFADGAKATRCLTTMLRTEMSGQMPTGTTLGDITLKVLPGPGSGPSNVIARISGTITVSASGHQLPVYLDSTYIAGKKIEAEVDFESFGAPVDAALRRKLIEVVAKRVADA